MKAQRQQDSWKELVAGRQWFTNHENILFYFSHDAGGFIDAIPAWSFVWVYLLTPAHFMSLNSGSFKVGELCGVRSWKDAAAAGDWFRRRHRRSLDCAAVWSFRQNEVRLVCRQ